MEQKNLMLKLGGYINILIAIAHIVGLFWADKMFEVTGVGNEMAKLAQTHFSLPYLLTIFVAILFFIFGLYGLSAYNKFRPLPLLKPVIFAIAGIYLLRGIGELIFDLEKQQANQFLEITYSLIAVIIGLLFFIGGLKKWKINGGK
jgi:MFS superfamily sulfate permease-like transporter